MTMVKFLYWATVNLTGETVNFIDYDYYEIGTVMRYKGVTVTIKDFAVEKDDISCGELKMQMEDMRYYD